jgi:hypothetical protein
VVPAAGRHPVVDLVDGDAEVEVLRPQHRLDAGEDGTECGVSDREPLGQRRGGGAA